MSSFVKSLQQVFFKACEYSYYEKILVLNWAHILSSLGFFELESSEFEFEILLREKT